MDLTIAKRELAKLMAGLEDSDVTTKLDLKPTYDKLWQLLTHASKTQSESQSISKMCNQLNAYPKLFSLALRDARLSFVQRGEHALCESAIKILAWCLNQDRSGDLEIRGTGTEFLIETFFAADASWTNLIRTCIWGLRVIPGKFPKQFVNRLVELVGRANNSTCGKTLEENSGLMKCLAENSLEEIAGANLAQFIVPIVHSALTSHQSPKRRQKASEALTLCLPACWNHLDSISILLSPSWPKVSAYVNTSVKESELGSANRVHVAKYLGFILLLFGQALNEKEESTRKMRLNALMHAQHALLAECGEERLQCIIGWRFMIESSVVQNRVLETLAVLRKVPKEGFNAGREPDGAVRCQFFLTWTYLAQVVFELPNPGDAVELNALLGTLRRALGDCDVNVRKLATEYAVKFIRVLQKQEREGEEDANPLQTTWRRRERILDLTTPFDCIHLSHGIRSRLTLADLIGLFDNSLKTFPELDRSLNLDLWRTCSPMWAAAISINEGGDIAVSKLGEELAQYVWGEICHRFVGETQVECVVRGVQQRGRLLLSSPAEFIEWILRVFAKRTVPRNMALQVIELCGGVADGGALRAMELTPDLYRFVLGSTSQWMGRIFSMEAEFDALLSQTWESAFLALSAEERRTLVVNECVGNLPQQKNILACKALAVVCANVGISHRAALLGLTKYVAQNIPRVALNQSMLLDCAVHLLDKTSEEEAKFQLIVDCLFSEQGEDGNDALVHRTLALLFNRMKRVNVLYDLVLIRGLQARDCGIRAWVAEFWNNGTTFREQDCSPRLVRALQSAKQREFPDLRGISAPSNNKRVSATPPPSQLGNEREEAMDSGGRYSSNSNKQPRMSEKKDKQARLGVTTYSGLDVSQPLFGSGEYTSSEEEESPASHHQADYEAHQGSSPALLPNGLFALPSSSHSTTSTTGGGAAMIEELASTTSTLHDLTLVLDQVAQALSRDGQRLVRQSGEKDVAQFELAAQKLLVALWQSKASSPNGSRTMD